MTGTVLRYWLLGVGYILCSCHVGWGQTESVLHRFAGGWDGAITSAPLVSDAEGNLYGTTQHGGYNSCTFGNGCGTVFELSPEPGGRWKKRILYRFLGGRDGANPYGGLVFDRLGNLYGTTGYGGVGGNGAGDGTVFELQHSAGERWTERVLYRFHRRDGLLPTSALVWDSEGNLYGTTAYGGQWDCTYYGLHIPGCGVVFELEHTNSGWKERVLHIFTGMDGSLPYDGITFEGSGSLHGVTFEGGTGGGLQGGGVVFQLTPAGTNWIESTVYNFSGSLGRPVGHVLADEQRNLYGATKLDGDYGYGSVFELSPSGSTWNLTNLHSFTGGADGGFPLAGIVADGLGNIYGTTGSGPICQFGRGIVYRLDKSNNWFDTVLYEFQGGRDGTYPWASLLLDEDQNVYGTTYAGGDSNCKGAGFPGCGIVFKISY